MHYLLDRTKFHDRFFKVMDRELSWMHISEIGDGDVNLQAKK